MLATATATVNTTRLSGAQQDASYIPRGPVTAELNFYKAPADGSKPYNYVETPPEGHPQTNVGTSQVSVTLEDIRGHESDFNLEKDAFQALQNIHSKMTYEDWEDDDKIKSTFYPEVEKLLLDKVAGSHKITLFDHTIRRSHPNAHRTPVTRVHVDQTTRSTEWRVRLHDPDEAEELLKGRFRIINVWRPLNGPVQATPLGFASAASVEDEDLVPVEHRYPHRTGETAAVQYNKDQQYFYWSGMQNNERLFLKCYDNKERVGQRAPHTAFVDPRTPEGARGRESIEVRALVYG